MVKKSRAMPLLNLRPSWPLKKGETYPTSHFIKNKPTANSADPPCSAVWRDGNVVDRKGDIGWCLFCG